MTTETTDEGASCSSTTACTTSTMRAGDLALEERHDRDLVGRAHDRGEGPAELAHPIGEIDRGEGLAIDRLERELLVGERHRPDARRQPFRPAERELDRQAHVRHRELRAHRAVAELSERVDDALRVDHDVDLRVLEPEQVLASITSRPLFIRVAESIVIFGPICQTGCASASFTDAFASSACVHPRNGPPEPVSTTRLTSPRRSPRRHWASAACSESTGTSRSGPLDEIDDELAADHQALLVGQREHLAGLQGRERRPQPRRAHERVQHHVGLGVAGEGLGGLGADQHLDAGDPGELRTSAAASSSAIATRGGRNSRI